MLVVRAELKELSLVVRVRVKVVEIRLESVE